MRTIRQKLQVAIVLAFGLGLFVMPVAAPRVSAAPSTPKVCGDGKPVPSDGICPYVPDPAIPNPKDPHGGNCTQLDGCDLINKYIQPLTNLLAALVGVIVVVSVMIGGIQYASSGGDPQKAAAARARIRNAIIALIAFVLLYSGLNFLIPGGLLL